MILVDCSKNKGKAGKIKVTVIEGKGGRPKKEGKVGNKVKAHIKYELKDGTRVVGVTTALGILAKPALIYWSWDLGMKGIDFRKFRDDKADIGSLTHEMILMHLKKEKIDTSDYAKSQIDLAKICFKKYLDWESKYKIEPILLETPMTSERFKYGGTIDGYCKLDGKLTLIDYKTSKAIYENPMLYQLAAYKQLLEEHGYKTEEVRILRIGRNEEEGFEERKMIDLKKHFEIFRSCLNIYKLQKELKR